jgi:hypothetical protein
MGNDMLRARGCLAVFGRERSPLEHGRLHTLLSRLRGRRISGSGTPISVSDAGSGTL